MEARLPPWRASFALHASPSACAVGARRKACATGSLHPHSVLWKISNGTKRYTRSSRRTVQIRRSAICAPARSSHRTTTLHGLQIRRGLRRRRRSILRTCLPFLEPSLQQPRRWNPHRRPPPRTRALSLVPVERVSALRPHRAPHPSLRGEWCSKRLSSTRQKRTRQRAVQLPASVVRRRSRRRLPRQVRRRRAEGAASAALSFGSRR